MRSRDFCSVPYSSIFEYKISKEQKIDKRTIVLNPNSAQLPALPFSIPSAVPKSCLFAAKQQKAN